MSSAQSCGSGGGDDRFFGLRVASVFIILVGSAFGALFPIVTARTKWLKVPQELYSFAKYFGSGVIIATAFIHLLAPAISELSSPCLSPAWGIYPYPLALCMLSIFSLFVAEIIAYRWGTAKLKAAGIGYVPHSHEHPPGSIEEKGVGGNTTLEEANPHTVIDESAIPQIIGVAILEFGVVLHSVLIGLTLAVDERFKILFVVIVFHQMFEGLGIGSRLALMKLPSGYNHIPFLGGILYAITTPIGIAVGLGIRSTYNPGSVNATIVSGILDSLSSGILLYTGLVELLAHEFLFNKDLLTIPARQLTYNIICMLFGCAIMSLLGRWA